MYNCTFIKLISIKITKSYVESKIKSTLRRFPFCPEKQNKQTIIIDSKPLVPSHEISILYYYLGI